MYPRSIFTSDPTDPTRRHQRPTDDPITFMHNNPYLYPGFTPHGVPTPPKSGRERLATWTRAKGNTALIVLIAVFLVSSLPFALVAVALTMESLATVFRIAFGDWGILLTLAAMIGIAIWGGTTAIRLGRRWYRTGSLRKSARSTAPTSYPYYY